MPYTIPYVETVGLAVTFQQDRRCAIVFPSWLRSRVYPKATRSRPAEVLFDAPDEYLTCQPEVGAGMAAERATLARPNVDNPWLLPGEFVVGPDGRLVTTYRFQFCEHWIDPRANLAAIRFASGELRPAY